MNRIYVCMEHPFAILETHLVAWHIVSYSDVNVTYSMFYSINQTSADYNLFILKQKIM